MGKVFSFSELKGKVKVGWKIRRGANNNSYGCSELEDADNTAEIDKVDDLGFCINGCYHYYSTDNRLEVVSGYEKDWDSLEYGDILIDSDGMERKVLDVLPHLVFVAEGVDNIADGYYTPEEMQQEGWEIKGTEPETTELTLKEIADKFQVPVSLLRVKDN